MKKWVLIELFVALAILFIVFGVFGVGFGPIATPAHAPNPADLMEINALNRMLDDEFNFLQSVRIAFSTQENPRNKSLPIYHLSHDLRYSFTAGLCIMLTGPKESRFNDVINRIRSIVNAQGINTFKIRRTDGKFFREEVIFLKCDFGDLQQREWIRVWEKIFMEYTRFFYNIKIENIETIKISNPDRRFVPFKNVLTA